MNAYYNKRTIVKDINRSQFEGGISLGSNDGGEEWEIIIKDGKERSLTKWLSYIWQTSFSDQYFKCVKEKKNSGPIYLSDFTFNQVILNYQVCLHEISSVCQDEISSSCLHEYYKNEK